MASQMVVPRKGLIACTPFTQEAATTINTDSKSDRNPWVPGYFFVFFAFRLGLLLLGCCPRVDVILFLAQNHF